MRTPSLTGSRAFNAAAEHLSFKRAAEQLSVSPAALSFQIRQLEQSLDCELFVRKSRQVQLSAEGALIQTDIRAGFDHFERALRRLQQRELRPCLNIACGPTFSANWLSPRLHSFLLLQPQLDTRISASLTLVDLHRDDVDVALRFSSDNQPDCRVIKLVDEYMTPMCSPSLLQDGAPLKEPSDLSFHTLIHSSSCDKALGIRSWSQWLERAGETGVNPDKSGLHFDVPDHALNSAVAGAGVVLGREVLAQRDLEAGRLCKPFELRMKTQFSFYAVVLEERVDEPAIAAFLTWIKQQTQVKSQ